MNAGKRDRKIAIHSASDSTSATGINTETWSLHSNEYAEVKNLKGQELVDAGQLAGGAQVKFRIPYNNSSKTITNKHRVVLDSKAYDILHALPIPGGRPREIELYTRRSEVDLTPVLGAGNQMSTKFNTAGNLTVKAAGGF